MSLRRPTVAAAVATLAVACLLAAGAAALRPPDAHAWAWSDECTIFAANRSGSQSSVRPAAYIPVLPSTAGEATFATFAIVGIPTSGFIPFQNTGYPVSWGCHVVLAFINPGSNVNCNVSAPTKGANTFNCSGNMTYKITNDSDDITGEVYIAAARAKGLQKPLKGSNPPVRSGALRTSELPGGGWQVGHDITDLGVLGAVMEAGTLPKSCQDGAASDASTPDSVRTTQLFRDDGDESVANIETTYSNDAEASAQLDEVLSDQSINCLAKLLTTKKYNTTVSVAPLTDGQVGGTMRGRRLVVRGRSGGQVTWTSYLDVVGGTDGSKAAILMIASEDSPTSAKVSNAAVKAALD